MDISLLKSREYTGEAGERTLNAKQEAVGSMILFPLQSTECILHLRNRETLRALGNLFAIKLILLLSNEVEYSQTRRVVK